MEELLIEKVRQHDFLYNYKSVHYRDASVRLSAWEEIGRDLQISAFEAKDTWERLRRCFCNARNRRREDSKTGIHKKSTWKYEQQMSFVLPFLETRNSYVSVHELPSAVPPTCLLEENLPHSDSDANISQITVADDTHGPNARPVKLEPSSDPYQTLNTNFKGNGHRKDNSEPKVLPGNEDSAKKRRCEESHPSSSNFEPYPCFSNFESNLKNMDETDMFFLSMSSVVKRLPKVEQARIKLDLSNAVLLAEIKHLQHHSESRK